MAELLVDAHDHVVTFTINRPEKANTISRDFSEALIEALREYDADRQLWVAIITGAGEKFFSAGADLKDERMRHGTHSWEATYFESLFSVSKPMIAAVNGWCLGAGFGIAMACDLRIAATTARFGTPDQKLNTVDCAASVLLSRMIPSAIAMEILFTGEPIDAAEAYRVGFVNKVVPPADLIKTAGEFAARVCANGPLAVAACKRINREAHTLPLAAAAALFARIAEPVLASHDTQVEGIAAFLEKRRPVWRAE
jgi:enoyl-CoA hydratase/carnithine racemase